MPYESTISFTLDTICPWTYLAKRRLDHALHQYREANPSSQCTFTIRYMPFQLYPEASQEGEDKYAWYKKSKYGDSDEKMKMYTTLMSAYGVSSGIDFKFGGTVANTLHAHRLIQHFQETKGPDVADKIVNSLYSSYFENEKHPSSTETLLKAATDAGISDEEAKNFIEDESEGMMEVKMLIREQAGNGVDAVPYIVFEGRKRDLTLQGAKEVDEYVRVLEIIAKESS
jgi:predicted DsbA family dithiol-disulfide isomerase